MLTTRQARTVVSNLAVVTRYYRNLLDSLKSGDSLKAIRAINSIRPIDEVQTLLGRVLSTSEQAQYLQAMGNVRDAKLAKAIGAAKILQDARQACRKQIQYHNLQGATQALIEGLKAVKLFYK